MVEDENLSKKMVEDENGFDGGKSDFFNDIKPKKGSDQIKKNNERQPDRHSQI